jgi:hypothetical protein
VRIDQIFIHKWDKEQRLFIMATRIDISIASTSYLNIAFFDASLANLKTLRSLSAFLWSSLASCTSCQSLTISDADRSARHQMLKLGGPDDKELLWMERSLQWL